MKQHATQQSRKVWKPGGKHSSSFVTLQNCGTWAEASRWGVEGEGTRSGRLMGIVGCRWHSSVTALTFFFCCCLFVPFFVVLLCCILPRSSAYSVTRLHHMIYCSLSFKTSCETHMVKFNSKVLFDHCPLLEVALDSQLPPWNIHCRKCQTEIVTFLIHNFIISGNRLICFICSTFLLTSKCVLFQSPEVTKYIYTRFKVLHISDYFFAIVKYSCTCTLKVHK